MARETGRTGYKVKLKKTLTARFPGCFFMDNDPNDSHQGIPDLTVYWNGRWGMLETKAGSKSAQQPNQAYWVDHYNQLGFASFIYPENEEEVLNALQSALTSRGSSLHSQR